jgi:hypothetical protein
LRRVGIIDQKSATLFPFTPAETILKLQRAELDGAVYSIHGKAPPFKNFFLLKM